MTKELNASSKGRKAGVEIVSNWGESLQTPPQESVVFFWRWLNQFC